MSVTEEEMLDNDYYNLSDDELEVLFIVDEDPILRTRLQKIALLYSKAYNADTDSYGAYLFGGYSDEVDESSDSLVDKGIIQETTRGYVITGYGQKLKVLLSKGLEDSDDLIHGIPNLKKSVSRLSDKSIVGLTYHFFKETTVNSTIKDSVDRYNARSMYDGKSLDDISKEEFLGKLKEGKVIRRTDDHGQEI
jgi:uncharacterized protein YwgA